MSETSARLTSRQKILFLTLALLVAAAVALPFWKSFQQRIRPFDEFTRSNGARLERRGSQTVLQLSGTPEEMGRQHGALLKKTIQFTLKEVFPQPPDPALIQAVRKMRTALPEPILRELDACAAEAGVDADLLLLAQSEGDIREAAQPQRKAGHSCSSYVLFGAATADGKLECGRNLDYTVNPAIVKHSSLVSFYAPDKGHRFASVGFAGVITGWTLINEHGLVIANHLGGGEASQVEAIPTCLLLREIAQHARTVDEGLAILRNSKRMRGQIIWMAQDADTATQRAARAVCVEFDAAEIKVREAEESVLLVTNTNRIFHKEIADAAVPCGRYRRLRQLVTQRKGKAAGAESLSADDQVANASTLHTVYVRSSERRFSVRFRNENNALSEAVWYAFPVR